jgi:glycosyltransferase involved in cell wall biosynthesis
LRETHCDASIRFTDSGLCVIVFLHGAPAFGAVESYVIDIAGEVEDTAAIVYPDVPELEPFRALPLAEHVRLSEALLSRPAPMVVASLVRILLRLKPDVVHVTDVWPAAMIAARIARVRQVIVTHHTPELPRRDNLMGRVWWRIAWSTRPETIYTSRKDKEFDSGHVRGTTHVVYYGIDLARWMKAAPALEHDGPIVGTAARFVEQKGLDLIVEAAPLVLEKYPLALFAIVGDGPQRPVLERMVREKGLENSFIFPGMRQDVEKYVSSFDVYVLPSYFEGLCYAVIEAQVAGVPVVATPVGGVAENVIEGVTGRLMEIGSARSLAEGVIATLDRPEDAAAAASEARGRAIALYARDRMLAETTKLYKLSGGRVADHGRPVGYPEPPG